MYLKVYTLTKWFWAPWYTSAQTPNTPLKDSTTTTYYWIRLGYWMITLNLRNFYFNRFISNKISVCISLHLNKNIKRFHYYRFEWGMISLDLLNRIRITLTWNKK